MTQPLTNSSPQLFPSTSIIESFMDDRVISSLAHLAPSHLQWTDNNGVLTRPLGLVEMFFHKMALMHQGRTDIFFRLPMRIEGDDSWFDKLPIAWARLNQLHPSLSYAVIEDGSDEPMFSFDPTDLSGEPAHVVRNCSQTIIVERNFKDDVVEWMREQIWNGDRQFLNQSSNLGRLIALHNSTTGEVDIIMAVAHCISDGTSVAALANEFLEILTSNELDGVNGSTVKIPTLSDYREFKPQLVNEGSLNSVTNFLDLTKEDIVSALPLAMESAYPPMPLTTRPPTLPRLRWYWAIRRVIAQVRGNILNRLSTVDFVGERSPSEQKELEPSWGALTNWKHFTLSSDQTNGVMRYAKECDVKIGSLLFAASSIVISNLNHIKQIDNGDTCLIGFPFSIRPYLDQTPNKARSTPLDVPSIMEISPLSVQLGFGGIQLPSTPCLVDSETFKIRFKSRAQSAQSQFRNLLSSATLLHDGHCMAMARARTFSEGHDGWKIVKQTESNSQLRGKGTAINGSMLGSMDKILKPSYTAKTYTLSLDNQRQAYIGVRCRTQEVLLETFTLNGQLTISLGYDRVLWPDETLSSNALTIWALTPLKKVDDKVA
ncbi:hypothetical protein E3Q22_04279 [Wallemia mellicola]|uniref:CoA-dependent acyltransferase n=1 Tax=Wallemia mellicola TaxID=1708541 RepID=A0A4T0LV16_9BASI|nr:hypothetical protein E3Q22_04279 [Wallemia mellicola]TIB98999.1 hypothetical protein E3Q16_04241 [Wallemia mellicola]TIC36539.1 hypothetical protein E3Q08_04270 [Wallemia mellicola]